MQSDYDQYNQSYSHLDTNHHHDQYNQSYSHLDTNHHHDQFNQTYSHHHHDCNPRRYSNLHQTYTHPNKNYIVSSSPRSPSPPIQWINSSTRNIQQGISKRNIQK